MLASGVCSTVSKRLYPLNCDHPMQGIARGGILPMMTYTGIFFRLQVSAERVRDQNLSFGSVKGPKKG